MSELIWTLNDRLGQPSLVTAFDRLRREPDGFDYDPDRFVSAVRSFVGALCKIEAGRKLLSDFGNFVVNKTAQGTAYSEHWRKGVRSALRLMPPSDTRLADHSSKLADRITRRESFLKLRRSSRRKSWLSHLEVERHHIDRVLRVFDGTTDVRAGLTNWWSADDEIISEGMNRRADGCRFLLEMYQGKHDSGGAELVADHILGECYAGELKATADRLMLELDSQRGSTPVSPPQKNRTSPPEEETALQDQQPKRGGKTKAALQELQLHPEWTNKQIAAAVGCSESLLSQSGVFRAAREALCRSARKTHKTSRNARTGEIEYYQEN